MNFGNPPLFPSDTKLICVNGSHEEIEFNRSADHLLLCDPGAFFESLLDLKHTNQWSHDQVWLDINLKEREKWISASIADLKKTTDSPAWSGGKIHPLQLSLSVQNVMKNEIGRASCRERV